MGQLLKNKSRVGITLLCGLALILTYNAYPGTTTSTELNAMQGSSNATSQGDYISASAGLNTYYAYFLEVPADVASMEIDIFDADVGIGTDNGLNTANQDKQRNSSWNTSVTYSLRDPLGNVRPINYTTGNSSGPSGSDQAWTNIFTGGGLTVRDEFSSNSFGNDDGTDDWEDVWGENGEADGTGSGSIRVNGGTMQIRGTGSNQRSVEREVDLSATGLNATTATLTFDWRTTSQVDSDDTWLVEVSDDGGSNWNTLESFDGNQTTVISQSYDITTYIADDTRVRFRNVDYDNGNERLRVDNVQIEISGAIAGHWELRADMNSGTDVAYMGVRAHDGDETRAGTEINIYFDSYASYGVNNSPNTHLYTHYPWITSGCNFDANDFDWDDNQAGSQGSIALTTPGGTAFQTFSPLSGQDTWANNVTNTFTTDDEAEDYGVWTMDVNITNWTNSSNYGEIYFGSDQASNPAPTGQPETGAFRIYLQQDDGSDPVKPRIRQYLTHEAGPNPPTVGNTSDFYVTVVVENPTGTTGPITFSASDVVQANIPGSGVVYNGNAVVTAGSILTQPSVGGTGNITWNPGTVDSGDTESMFYEIAVTPAGAGSLDVTAAPGSGNGTQATWVDETENSSQSRSSYTFGELCELRVDTTDATLALITDLAIIPYGDGMVLEWSTAAQAGTTAFQVERQHAGGQWNLVGPSVPALLSAVHGAHYRVLDRSGSRTDLRYRILEKENTGATITHGPFDLKVDWDRDGGSLQNSFAVMPKALNSDESSSSSFRQPSSYTERVDLLVGDRGLYRVTAAELAAASGQDLNHVTSLIQSHRISLTNQGESIAWKPGANSLSLDFFAETIDSPYTLNNVYRLQFNAPGLWIKSVGAISSKAASGPSFVDHQRFEVDDQPIFLLPLDPEGDFWAWGFVRADQGSQAQEIFDFEVIDPAQGRSTLTLDLRGGAEGAHRVDVSLGGTFLGEVEISDLGEISTSFELPKGLLQGGPNQVELTATQGSLVFLDGFDLDYPRLLEAHENRLETSVDRAATVRGFTDPSIWVLDVSNPAQPMELSPTITFAQGHWQATFAPINSGEAHWLSTETAFGDLEEIRPVTESPLTTLQEGDYVIITSEALRSGAEDLANYRASQGHSPLIVTVEEIQSEFSYGIADPRAIRDFLAWAWTEWTTPPEYAVLLGDGHWDYRDLLGLGAANHVPPLMALADGALPGLFATDSLYADTSGEDGRPEIALGRIPADSVADINRWIEKISDYEKNRGRAAGGHRILHLADNPDHGGDFESQLDLLDNAVPSNFSVERINLAESDPATVRADLFSQFSSGLALMTFDGHGGVDRLASEGLLLAGDIPNLDNANRLPILAAATCYINYSAIPGYDALGEALTMDETQGAVAVIAPVWLSGSDFGRRTLSGLYNHLFSQEMNLGEALRLALGEVGNAEQTSLRLRWTLLGDPALKVQLLPEASVIPPSSE